MTRAAGLTRLLVKTYVLFSLYRALRLQAPASMSNDAREVFHDHYRDQLELLAALAKHLLKLGGDRSTKLAPIVRSIDTFDGQRRTCAADHLRVLLAAHQAVLAETKSLASAGRALHRPGTAEVVGRVAQTNELQIGIVAGQLSMLASTPLADRALHHPPASRCQAPGTGSPQHSGDRCPPVSTASVQRRMPLLSGV